MPSEISTNSLVFDRGLRGAQATSRVLGIGHTLFDIALEEARTLPINVAEIDGLSAPLLIVSVEDEVTGTGALVHQMIFGLTEREGMTKILRDGELLQFLNSLGVKAGTTSVERIGAPNKSADIAERLKLFFDPLLPTQVPAMRRPVSWPEMLLLPSLIRSASRISCRFVAHSGALAEVRTRGSAGVSRKSP